eukprot:m.94634 g.94634  ORF g.94634 m.94634 type:complete len:59 (-) comp8927_c0_seq1:2029-2205(-)
MHIYEGGGAINIVAFEVLNVVAAVARDLKSFEGNDVPHIQGNWTCHSSVVPVEATIQA